MALPYQQDASAKTADLAATAVDGTNIDSGYSSANSTRAALAQTHLQQPIEQLVDANFLPGAGGINSSTDFDGQTDYLGADYFSSDQININPTDLGLDEMWGMDGNATPGISANRGDFQAQSSNNPVSGLDIRTPQEQSTEAWDFVKLWINKNPGGYPDNKVIEGLAAVSARGIHEIRSIFGQILSANTLVATDNLVPSTWHLPAQDSEIQKEGGNGIASPLKLQQASQYLAQNRKKCGRQNIRRSSHEHPRIYPCTSSDCESCFSRRASWKEHEEIRNPPRAFVCCLDATVVVDNVLLCSFCGIHNPDDHHIKTAHPTKLPCSQEPLGVGSTIFYPKDLFQSHYKNIHPRVPKSSRAIFEKKNVFEVPQFFEKECSRCSGQKYQFKSWNDRCNHIATEHFENDHKRSRKNLSSRSRPSTLSSSHDATPAEEDGRPSTTPTTTRSLPSLDSSGIHLNSTEVASGIHLSEPLASTVEKREPKRPHTLPSLYGLEPSPLEIPSPNASQNIDESRSKSYLSAFSRLISRGRFDSFIGFARVTDNDTPDLWRSILGSTTANGKPVGESGLKTSLLDKFLPKYSPSKLKSDSLEERLINSRIKVDDSHFFVPNDVLSEYITKQAITTELVGKKLNNKTAKSLSALTDRIHSKYKRVFAILLMMNKASLIEHFLHEGLSDVDLPFADGTSTKSLPKLGENFNSVKTSTQRNVELMTKWKMREIADFCRLQWCVLAPVFSNNQEIIRHYDLDDNVVLPFIEDSFDSRREGGFSTVWKVVVHPAHQDFDQGSAITEGRGIYPIAVKKLHSTRIEDFQKEADMLKQLSQRTHPNLIRLLGTYSYRQSHHFLFPYAEDNLRDYWSRYERLLLTHNHVLWTLKQMQGIASGLATIHNYAMSGSITPQGFNIPSDDQATASTERRFGRHGDIKPENILWFNEGPNDKNGKLVITDFGLTDFHKLDSRSKVKPESIGGTSTYQAPELELLEPISPSYDIWSLGCVYLEFITWLLEGQRGLDEFSSFREFEDASGLNYDRFYQVNHIGESGKRRAFLSPRVLEWIDRLRQHEQASCLIHDLLELIREKLLVIESKDRISSRDLVRELDMILERTSHDQNYLFGANPTLSLQKSAVEDETLPSRDGCYNAQDYSHSSQMGVEWNSVLDAR